MKMTCCNGDTRPRSRHGEPSDVASSLLDMPLYGWRGREKLHYLNPMPIHEIYERWIGKYERTRLQTLSERKNPGGEARWIGPRSCTRSTSLPRPRSSGLRSPGPSLRDNTSAAAWSSDWKVGSIVTYWMEDGRIDVAGPGAGMRPAAPALAHVACRVA